MSDDCIRVLSLNCWGLKYVSKNRVARIDAIAAFLATPSYDIICLQELWVRKDFETILASVSSYLPYFKLFHGGVVGVGLVIFSRFPVVAATLQSYSLNGSPLDLKGADWFSAKAASSVLVLHPVLGQLQIFNTHFFSEGGDDGPEYLRAHRLVNAWEFAKLVKQSAEIGRYTIAAGDFNSVPHTLPMTIVREHSGLEDVWNVLHPPSDISHQDTEPINAISRHGFTYGSLYNSYSSQSPADGEGKRIDYVLFRDAAPRPEQPSASLSTSPPRLVPTHARVVFVDPVPGRSFSYSDHFGVEATFRIEHSGGRDKVPFAAAPIDKGIPVVASTAGPTSVKAPRLSREHAIGVIEALKISSEHSYARSRRELRVFFSCALLLLLLLVGTGWSPKGYLTPLFAFLSTILTWTGTTMFNVGFLYGRWETNTLQNVIEEIELYVHSYDMRYY